MSAGVLISPAAFAQQAEDVCNPFGNTLFCTRLTPQSDTKPVGSSHTVTATNFFIQDGSELPTLTTGVITITSGPDAGLSQNCFVPPGGGGCTFTFTNNGTPGTDTIEFVPLNSQFPSATATVTFVEPTSPTPEQQQQDPAAGGGVATSITQEGEQESEAGEIDQSFDVS